MPAIVRLIDGIDVYDGLRNDLPEGWRCSNLLNGTFLTSGTVKVELRETGRGSKSLRELCARGMEARCPPNAPCPNPVCCDRKQMPYRFVSHARGQEGKVLQKASDSPCHFRTPLLTFYSVVGVVSLWRWKDSCRCWRSFEYRRRKRGERSFSSSCSP